ncbi:uncharacterized protein LOC126166395 [Schistocerca cancellata]|uniref:uncharacterized protein LOC126166395 n=1 Tax=Schistocerca cancellata TaxID=274614 RepID=UPI002118E444|nr:uncharacterized protein LOC126166395 [Schistocerca cancellata]
MSSPRAPIVFGSVAARLLHSFSPASAAGKQLCFTSNIMQPLKNTRTFTRKNMMKNYGVLPLVGIMAAVPVAVGVFCIYQIATRDVSFNRKQKPSVEQMDLTNPKCYKLVNTNPDHYKPNKELADLLKEMSEAEKAQATSQ